MSQQVLTLSVREAARALGIGLHSVYRAIREKRLPALKVGTKPKLRIPKAAIRRLLRDPGGWDGRAEKREPRGREPQLPRRDHNDAGGG